MKFIFVIFALWLVAVNAKETISKILQSATDAMQSIDALRKEYPACVVGEDVKAYSGIHKALADCDSKADRASTVIRTDLSDYSQQTPDYCSQDGALLALMLLTHIHSSIKDCIANVKLPVVLQADNEALKTAKANVVAKVQTVLQSIFEARDKQSACVDDYNDNDIVEILNAMENAKKDCATKSPADHLPCFQNAIANANEKVSHISAAIVKCISQTQ